MINGDLALMCPQLVELKILDYIYTDNKDFLQALSIPKTVKDLIIPYSYLSYMKSDLKLQFLKDNPVLRSRVKFPDGLIKLTIRGHHDTRRAIALDFHLSKLPNLEELSLVDTGHTLSFGNFTKSLKIFKQKNFTNCGVGGIFTPRSFDFKKFQNLDNLREFNLQGISKSRDFFYKFPDSLERLVCPDNGITRVRIYGDGIKYLDLSGNRLSNLNEENFVIPEKVKELNLSDSHIYSITAKFPDCLQKLDLKGNSLKILDNLPDNLRYLDCQRNKLGDGNLVCNFPIGLEWLNLELNPLLRPDLIADLNLSQCTRLKFLSLSCIEMNSLDLNSLPHSLTRLNLSECRLMSFVGSFARFQDLEDINLKGNCLKGYFYKAYNSYGILFGNKIKVVRLLQNSLLTLDVEVLRNELSRKSTFKKLEINNKLIEQPNPTENYQVEASTNNEISGLAMTRPTKQRKLNP